MREPDWKEFVAPPADMSPLKGALLETDCPKCGRHVGALIIDGPDPVFADLVCSRVECGHLWTERTA